MNTVFIVIMAILALVVLLNMSKPSRPSPKFDSMCSPGYMPTGSGCVPTNEDIGMGPRP
jgi:hypothetical protein